MRTPSPIRGTSADAGNKSLLTNRSAISLFDVAGLPTILTSSTRAWSRAHELLEPILKYEKSTSQYLYRKHRSERSRAEHKKLCRASNLGELDAGAAIGSNL